MRFLYQLSIYFYYFAALIVSIFKPKAKLWIQGRKDLLRTLENEIKNNDEIYWFHCASLGEFEQGKPIIDRLKIKNKHCKIIITFFSPSGYEARKEYEHADWVYYLPIDTPKNARQFLDIVQPQQAFFIKYEFWFNYLYELKQRGIPTYLISGIFRKDQLFFKWYGFLHKKMLGYFTYFFLQNADSKELLATISITNTTVSGDTRLDRVYENSLQPKSLPLIEQFKENKKVIILGSSWRKEEEIIAEYIQSSKKEFKFIIAPHDINTQHIEAIKKLLKNDYICYSAMEEVHTSSKKVLIIDNIGLLSHIYQYTDIALIGGGFKNALHNILEPASFNNAILFGPQHDKFPEAQELIKTGGAYQINDLDDLIGVINRLTLENNLEETQTKASDYIKNGIGATKIIFNNL